MRNHLDARYKNEYEQLKRRENEKPGAAKIHSLVCFSRQCTKTDLKQIYLINRVEKN